MSVVMGKENRAITDCIKEDLYWSGSLCGIGLGCLSQEQAVEAGCSVSPPSKLLDSIYFRKTECFMPVSPFYSGLYD